MSASPPGGTDPGEEFFVAAREFGQQRPDLPLWGLREGSSSFSFLKHSSSDRLPVEFRELPGVAGGFQLLNVLSSEECDEFVRVLDGLGFHEDAAVSLPHSFRHMCNCNMVVPEQVDEEIFTRCKALLPDIGGCKPLGINAKFRCYRYLQGDYFRPHTDGAWPGSRVRGGHVLGDAYGDRLSQLTFLLLLSDGYGGGETRFFGGPGPGQPTAETKTPKGAVLCFPHGHHPLSPLHEGVEVTSGAKYMIRTEVLYSHEALAYRRAAV